MTFNTFIPRFLSLLYTVHSAHKSNTQESYYTVSNRLTDRRLIL